jgi:glycosyltransferase involved in cell wall biosynthesis
MLMRRVAELGIEEMFRPLGLVPYRDIMSLLRWSVAVINPSLFEGWSTTVEEAKSMGKTVILSDIPTHREQSPDRGKYFSPHSPAQLATLLTSERRRFDDLEDQASVNAAALQLPVRRRAFALHYEDIVLELRKSRSCHGSGHVFARQQQ